MKFNTIIESNEIFLLSNIVTSMAHHRQEGLTSTSAYHLASQNQYVGLP